MVTAPSLHAYLSYDDAPAALKWFSEVGFEVVSRQEDPHGTVVHAEIRYGDATVMVAAADQPYDVPALKGRSVGAGLYLWLPTAPAVDDWHTAALEAGGREVFAPEDTEWGTRRSRVLDVGGYEWSVGTYRPGAAR